MGALELTLERFLSLDRFKVTFNHTLQHPLPEPQRRNFMKHTPNYNFMRLAGEAHKIFISTTSGIFVTNIQITVGKMRKNCFC